MYGPAPATPRYSNAGVDTANSRGTTLPYSGTINTKNATWTQIVASSAIHANGFYVYVTSPNAGDFCIDIAIGAGGSETIIAANLLVSNQTGNSSKCASYFIPIPIPAGTRISARQAVTTASAVVRITVQLVSELPGRMPPYARCRTYGARLTGGVQVDPGGSINTKGAYVAVGTATNDIMGLMFAIGARNNTARTTADVRLDINYAYGGGSADVVPDYLFNQDSIGDVFYGGYSNWYPMHLPSGGTIQARAQESITDATDRLFDVIVYTLD